MAPVADVLVDGDGLDEGKSGLGCQGEVTAGGVDAIAIGHVVGVCTGGGVKVAIHIGERAPPGQ